MNLTNEEVIRNLEEEISILKWIGSGMGSSEKTQEKLRNHPKLKEDFIRADRRIEALTIAIQSLKDYGELKKRVDEEGIEKILSDILNQNLYEVDGETLKVNVLPTEDILKQQSHALVSYLRGEKSKDKT